MVNDECECTVVQERPTAGMQRGKKGDFEEKSFDLICLKLQNYNYSLLSVVLFFSHLHKNATLIQKIWRGFTARVLFRQRVKVSCGDM